MVNLSQLDIVKSAGWSGLYVMDINDHGQMAGYGFIVGAIHAFLLTRPDGAKQNCANVKQVDGCKN